MKIENLKAHTDYSLELTFSDGRAGRVNIQHLIHGPVFEPLKDPKFFCLADIDDFGSVCWPNGADLAIERLIELLPKKVSSMVGNKNAQINDEPRDERIIIRVTSSMKKEFTEKAMNDGSNLSSWILNKLT